MGCYAKNKIIPVKKMSRLNARSDFDDNRTGLYFRAKWIICVSARENGENNFSFSPFIEISNFYLRFNIF